mgnify:CR=1 FL=1
MMLNRDLFHDPKDLKLAEQAIKIQKLENKIEAFRKYDDERKAYYKNALVRLGELEALFDEMSEQSFAKYREKLKKELSILQKRVFLDKVSRMPDEEVERIFNQISSVESLKKMQVKIKELKAQNSYLLEELVKCQKEVERLKGSGV